MSDPPERPRALRLAWLVYAVLPAIWVTLAGSRALGPFSVDLGGHVWNTWNAARGELLHSSRVGAPEGVDLVPVVGGWLDILLGAPLVGLVGPLVAYNLVLGGFLVVAGLGGHALARAFGASLPAALVAGALLQLDGFVLHHALGGRPEQAGLGFVALALAGALASWERPGTARAVLTGVAGAAVVLLSWELTVFLGCAMVFLAPFLVARSRPPGCWKRWGIAAATFAALALPWVALFLVRTSAVRDLDEGAFAVDTAASAAVGLVGWLAPRVPRPTYLALLALPLAPWLGRRRLLWVGVAIGCVLTVILALGPAPGLLYPGPPDATPWGPFHWLTRLPVLGWFHWPHRWLVSLSLASPVACALVLDRLGGRRAVGLGALLLLGALLETVGTGRWPAGRFDLPHSPAIAALAASPEPGAVVDLPVRPEPVRHLEDMLLQIEHGRPLLGSMFLPHLRAPGSNARLEREPLLRWFRALMDAEPPESRTFDEDDVRGLVDHGFRFVTLRSAGWPADRWRKGRRALVDSFGPPVWADPGEEVLIWRLP